MTIRAAGWADALAIANLHTASWQIAYKGILSDEFLAGALPENRRTLWLERLSDSKPAGQFVLVDDQGGAICGFACAILDADPQWGCLLDNLHVMPDLKGRGLGRQLMMAVAQQVMLTNPAGRLHLWAYEQNLGARRFYERLGGVIKECQVEMALDGTPVNAVRYCWSDLAGLAGHRS